MENIWIITTLLLAITLTIILIYYIYYRINIKNITKILEEIMYIEDTNQLVTTVANQKDIADLVKVINKLVRSTRKARIKIKRENESFRQSITNISHDLRTPLTTAGGYLQMILKGVSDDDRQEYLKIILERQNMVKMLLEQLFEYVRIESGEIEYECSEIDAKTIFLDTLAMYYDDFNGKGEEPVVIIPDIPCIISGNEQGIKRIFSNILFNALIHGSGDYCFEIKENDGYLFIFSNNSEPMTSEELDNIFERFYTQDKSRNKKTTGLGLAIAKEISKRLGGSICAYYNNGKLSIEVFFPYLKKKC